MSVTEQQAATTSAAEINLTTPNDRRQDIEGKQQQIATVLQEVGCEGLLLLDPANFAWLTSGGHPRGVIDPEGTPALYFSPEGRWILCANVDTQRIFDEEVDGLGFQLKEWPWHWSRQQLLADLVTGRKIACDLPFRDCIDIGEKLRPMRRLLSPYEQACYRALGQVVGHALEATCRSLNPGETEREIAGQLGHRLLHRGAQPLILTVVAEGLMTLYRQAGFTPRQVKSSCVLLAAAQKYGFCAMASRTVAFGEPPSSLRRAHDTACRVAATYIASSWPDAMPKQMMATAQRVYTFTGAEHEWLLCPQGHITGRAMVETPLLPNTEELLQANCAITWRASVGPALSCDTFLITEEGPRTLTIADNTWPLKRIRVQGADFVRPDLLIR